MSVCSFLSQQAAANAIDAQSSANTSTSQAVQANSTITTTSLHPHAATTAAYLLPGSTTQFQLNSNGSFGTNQASVGFQTTTTSGTATLTTMNHHPHLPFTTTNSAVHNLYNEKPILTLVNSNKLKTVNYKDHNLISIKSTSSVNTPGGSTGVATGATTQGMTTASQTPAISLVQISPASPSSSSTSSPTKFNQSQTTAKPIVRQINNNHHHHHLEPHKFMYKKAPNNQTILVLSKHQSQQKLSKSNNLISSYFNKDLLNKTTNDLIQSTTTTASTNSSLNPIPLNLFDPAASATAVTSTSATKPITLIPIGNLTDKQVLNSLAAENINFLQPMINLPPSMSSSRPTSSPSVNSMTNSNRNNIISNTSNSSTNVLEPSCLETIEISTACVEVEIDSSADQSIVSNTPSNDPPLDLNNNQQHHDVDKAIKKAKKAAKINKNSDKSKSSTKCKEIISCICEMDHDDGYMISCDNCHAWQHLACMEINRKKIPEKFNCTKCEPRATNSTKAKQIQERYAQKYLRNNSSSPASKMSPSPASRRNSNQNDIESSSSSSSNHSLAFNLTSTHIQNELSDVYVQFRSRVRLAASSKLKEIDNEVNENTTAAAAAAIINPECISKFIQSNCLKCVKVKNTSSDECTAEEIGSRAESSFSASFTHLKSFFLLKATQLIKVGKIVGEYKGRVMLVDELVDTVKSIKSPYFIVYKLGYNEISEMITSTTSSPSTPSSSNLPSSSSSTSCSHAVAAADQSKLVFVDASTVLFNMDPNSQQHGKNGRHYVIRKSCRPNTSVKHVIDSQGAVHFLIETKSAVQKLDEITLPFDLSFLYEASSRFDSIALDKFVYENRNFFTCQCNNASCVVRTKLKSSYYKKLLKKEKEPQVSSSSDAKRKRAYSTDSNQSEVAKSGTKNKAKGSKIKEDNVEDDATSGKNKQRSTPNTPTSVSSSKKTTSNVTSTPSSSLYEDEMNALLNNGKNLSREDRKLMSYMKVIEKLERQTNRKKELKEQREAAKLAAASAKPATNGDDTTVKENDAAASSTSNSKAKKQPRLSIKQEFVQNNAKVDQEHKLADMEIEHIIQKGGTSSTNIKAENSTGAFNNNNNNNANTTFHQSESPDYSFVNLAIQPRQTLDLLQRNLSSPANLLVSTRTKTLEPLENDVNFILKHQRNINTTNNTSLNSPNPLSPVNMVASPIDPSDCSRRDFFNPKKHWLKCSSISTESYSNLDPSTPMSAPPLKKRRHMVQFDEDSQQSDITVKSECQKNDNLSSSNLIIDVSLAENEQEQHQQPQDEPEQEQQQQHEEIDEEQQQQQQSESLLNDPLQSEYIQSLIHQTLASTVVMPTNDDLSGLPTASSSNISCYEMGEDSASGYYQVSSIGTSSSTTSMTELDSGSVNPNGKKKVSLAEYRMRKESTTTPITPTLASLLDIDMIDSPTSRFLAKPKPFLDSIFSPSKRTSVDSELQGISASTLLFLKQEKKEEEGKSLESVSKSMVNEGLEEAEKDESGVVDLSLNNQPESVVEDVEASFEQQTEDQAVDKEEMYEDMGVSRSRSVSGGENSSDLSRSRSDSVGSDYSLISSCSAYNQEDRTVSSGEVDVTSLKQIVIEPTISKSYSSITSISEDESAAVQSHQTQHIEEDECVKKSDYDKSASPTRRPRPRSTSRDKSRKRRESPRSHRSYSNERASRRADSRERNVANRIDYHSRSSRHGHHNNHHSSRHHDYRHRGEHNSDRSRRAYHESTNSFNTGYTTSRRKDYNSERKKQLDDMLDEYKRSATLTIQSKNLSSSSSRSNSSSISPRSIRVLPGETSVVDSSTIHTTPESINESHERSKSPKNISSSDLRYHLNSMK